MPELPEVDHMIEYLKLSGAIGQIYTGAQAQHAKWTALAYKLNNNHPGKLLTVKRKAKYMLFYFEEGRLICHNKFSGFWSLRSKPWSFDYIEFDRPPNQKDTRLLLTSTSDVLEFHDARALGLLDWIGKHDPGLVSYVLNQGPDVVLTPNTDLDYTEEWTLDKLKNSASHYPGSIKAMLLDQSMQAGIGNIYVCEILWWCGINPHKDAAKVTSKSLEEIFLRTQAVMNLALDHNISYDEYIMIFREANCPKCGGTVTRSVQQARGTYWCAICQK